MVIFVFERVENTGIYTSIFAFTYNVLKSFFLRVVESQAVY